MHLNDLKKQENRRAHPHGPEMNIDNASGFENRSSYFRILTGISWTRMNLSMGKGFLKSSRRGFGFLRSTDSNYLPGPGRHICVTVADKKIRAENGGHNIGPDQAAEGQRKILRPPQG